MKWGVFDSPARIDVAPTVGGVANGRHVIGGGSCWCGVRIDSTAGKPIVSHEHRTHSFRDQVCERCGKIQALCKTREACGGPR